MALGFTKPRYSPIAIDFGTDTLKVLQVSTGEHTQLVACAKQVIPELYRDDSAGRITYLADALRELLKRQPFKGKRAICSIPAHQTLIQPLEMDRADDAELDQQVGLHLIQRLNVDPARMVVRSTRVGKLVRNGQTKHQIMCIAARRDAVMKYIDLAHRCKLEVVGMHSEPMAVARAANMLGGKPNPDGATCFIDIGAAMTKLSITHGQQLIFAKVVHVGGDELTRELAHQRGIGFDDARQMRARADAKVAVGHAFATLAEEDTEPGGLSEHAEVIIESLTDELRLALRYYQGACPGRPVNQLVFVGGESENRSLCEAVARSLSVAAKLGDPFAAVDTLDQHENSEVEPHKPMPGWAVPLGLCFSEANL